MDLNEAAEAAARSQECSYSFSTNAATTSSKASLTLYSGSYATSSSTMTLSMLVEILSDALTREREISRASVSYTHLRAHETSV